MRAADSLLALHVDDNKALRRVAKPARDLAVHRDGDLC
jgi:hypothetical protein